MYIYIMYIYIYIYIYIIIFVIMYTDLFINRKKDIHTLARFCHGLHGDVCR